MEYALIMTLVDSGCRIGGLSILKGGDVGDSWLNVTEKTGERRDRLDAKLCDVLRRMAGVDYNLVFGLSDKALSMRFFTICRRAGLKGEKICPHTLRHSSAYLVAADTKNVMAVKAFLQHDNIKTSMIYVHDVEEEILKGISPLKLVADRISDGEVFA
jgi:integrase